MITENTNNQLKEISTFFSDLSDGEEKYSNNPNKESIDVF